MTDLMFRYSYNHLGHRIFLKVQLHLANFKTYALGDINLSYFFSHLLSSLGPAVYDTNNAVITFTVNPLQCHKNSRIPQTLLIAVNLNHTVALLFFFFFFLNDVSSTSIHNTQITPEKTLEPLSRSSGIL